MCCLVLLPLLLFVVLLLTINIVGINWLTVSRICARRALRVGQRLGPPETEGAALADGLFVCSACLAWVYRVSFQEGPHRQAMGAIWPHWDASGQLFGEKQHNLLNNNTLRKVDPWNADSRAAEFLVVLLHASITINDNTNVTITTTNYYNNQCNLMGQSYKCNYYYYNHYTSTNAISLSLSLSIYIYIYIHTYIHIYMYICSYHTRLYYSITYYSITCCVIL